MENKYDLAIIGAGPAGYVAAIRGGQVGLKTLLVEKEKIGGMCLNWGCIPSKALLESGKRFATVRGAGEFGVDGIDNEKLSFNWEKARKRAERIVTRLTRGIEFLLKKNQAHMMTGQAEILTAHELTVNGDHYQVDHILVATGSRPAPLPPTIPPEKVIELPFLLAMPQLPDRSVVYGIGPQAIELAQFFHLIGREVKLVCPAPEILPGLDPSLSRYITGLFRKEKIEIIHGPDLLSFQDDQLLVQNQRVPCDGFLNASGRQPVLPVSQVDFELQNNFIRVDENLQTSVPGIFAAGDVNGLSLFAHSASAQGLHVIDFIKGISKELPLSHYPVNIYTHPEMAQIGLTEPELKARGLEYLVSEFPLTSNGKAMTEGNTDGFIRLLSENKYGEVLGVQIVAPHATDMISEAGLLMEMEGTVYDLARAVHAHPTISEIFMEAGFAALDQPIHI